MLHAALLAGAAAAEAGADGPGMREAMVATIRSEPSASLFYAAAVDPDTLAPVAQLEPGDPVRLLIAAAIDGVRLIDNLAATARATR